MSRMIFVNLPVADLTATRAFYEGLGFTIDEAYSDERCACIVISDSIVVMAHERSRFLEFATGRIADSPAVTEVINCLSCDSREEVDRLHAAALAHGGRTHTSPGSDQMLAENPQIHCLSFCDPDGHTWEAMYMQDPS